MKRNLITFCLLIAACLTITGQKHHPPNPLPPNARAVLCGNEFYTEAEKVSAFQMMQAAGCQQVQFVEFPNGYWLGFGTRVEVVD